MLREEALFANEAFYVAFATRDLAAMDDVWAHRPDVVCIHPGWPALTDRATVMESWSRILGNARQPTVVAHALTTVPCGEAMLVVCYERLEDTVMVASNLFVPGAGGPRLLIHHAGLCSDPPELPSTRQKLDA